MRYAIGRVLWLLPTLAIMSWLAFWGISSREPGGGAPTEARLRALPLFYNPTPRDVRVLADEAIAKIAASGPDQAEGAGTLARLGGAALPHVLPRLDSLSPPARARVAAALTPLARRMRVGDGEPLRDPEAAAVFWQRYWEDRAIDFRPAVARRAVQRAARRASIGRRDELLGLDTYALPELIGGLGTVTTPADVERVATLTAIAAHVTGNEWVVAPNEDVASATRTAARWRRWWSAYGTDYLELDGPHRLAATVGETRYGKWAAAIARSGLGETATGEPILTIALGPGAQTLALVVWGLVGGLVVSLGLGTLSVTAHPSGVRAGVLGLTLVGATAPVGVLLMVGDHPTSARALGVVALALVGGGLAALHQRRTTADALTTPEALTWRAFGAGPWGCAWRVARSSTGPVLAMLGTDLPLLVSAAFVIEHVCGLTGLAAPTLNAVVRGDLPWLMALALVVTATGAGAQIASDALLIIVDPRTRAALSPRRAGEW